MLKTGVFLISACLISLFVSSHGEVGEHGETLHGGHGGKSHGLAGGDHGGSGYGGHKGGVKSEGYDRSFSFGTGHDSGKAVSADDEEHGGKGFGDKGFAGYGLGGQGYGGLGFGGLRVPFVFFG